LQFGAFEDFCGYASSLENRFFNSIDMAGAHAGSAFADEDTVAHDQKLK